MMRRYMNAVSTLTEAAAWRPTEREIGVFMGGGCAALALAIHKMTGLPLVALVEPDGENENPVHVMAKLADGRYLDVNGARTYDEILADCREEHECTTGNWSLVSASPLYLKLCIKDGIFDPITATLAAEARKVAARLAAAYGLLNPR